MILFSGSIFPIVNLEKKEDWNEVLQLTAGYLDVKGVNRLLKALANHCKSVIIERHYIDKDYRNTFANFHAKRFTTPPSRCLRLHFFSEHFTQESITSGNSLLAEDNKYLGYSVIRATRPNCIGRTLLSDRTRQDPNSHLCQCIEKTHVMGEALEVTGFPFISQDADATVCAESSLWMILRYLSNRYPTYAEVLPFDITSLANNHAIGHRVYPSGGLTTWQLSEALRLNKLSPIIYSRPRPPQNSNPSELQIEAYKSDIKKFEHLLYTYIESGFPLLTTVHEHVFPSYGHSSDFEKAPNQSDGKRVYSSEFNQSIIISDDNHFPYQSLQRRIPNPAKEDSVYTFNEINEFIVPLPEKVFLTAEDAQAAIENILDDSTTGIKAVSPSLSEQNLTLRLYLTSARAYKAKLVERGMGNPKVLEVYRQVPLPHFVWVCEIALTSEYISEHSIKGEVIWDATRNAREPHGWLAVHYPEQLAIDTSNVFNHPLADRSKAIQKIPLDNSCSYRLFQSNLKPIA